MSGMKRSVTRFAADVGAIGGKLNSVLGPLGIGIGIGAAVQGLNSLSAHVEQVVNTAESLGVGTDLLQGWEQAAIRAGASTDHASDSLRDFVERLGQARQGNEDLRKTFTDLGVAVDTDTVSQAFKKYLDGMSQMTDQAKRMTIAQKTMGEAGRRLIPAIAGGSAKFEELTNALKENGSIITRENLDAINELRADLTGLFESTVGKAGNFIGTMIRAGKAIGKLTESLREQIPFLGKFLNLWDLFGPGLIIDGLDEVRKRIDAMLPPEEKITDVRREQLTVSEKLVEADKQREKSVNNIARAEEKLAALRKQAAEKVIQRGKLTTDQLLAINPNDIKNVRLRRKVAAQQANERLAQRLDAVAEVAKSRAQTGLASRLSLQAESRRVFLTLLRDDDRGPNFRINNQIAEAENNLQRLGVNPNYAAPANVRAGVQGLASRNGNGSNQMAKDIADMKAAIVELKAMASPSGSGLKSNLHYPEQ